MSHSPIRVNLRRVVVSVWTIGRTAERELSALSLKALYAKGFECLRCSLTSLTVPPLTVREVTL